MYEHIVRPLLFAATRKDPERAHELTLALLEHIQHHSSLLQLMERIYRVESGRLACNVCGIKFANRLGLAPGFDKNALVLPALQTLGFGFIEIGAVLPDYGQPGKLERKPLLIPPIYNIGPWKVEPFWGGRELDWSITSGLMS